MKYFGIIALLLVTLGATGCSRVSAQPQDEVHMGTSTFIQKTATIKAGQKLKFIDEPSAGHVLVVGNGGAWIADPNAPTQLNNNDGMTIGSAQEIDVTFPNAGTFNVTCKVHPAMQMVVTVSP